MRSRIGMMGTLAIAVLMWTARPVQAADVNGGCFAAVAPTAGPLFLPNAEPASAFSGAFAAVSFGAPASCQELPATTHVNLNLTAGTAGAGEEQGPPAKAFLYSDAYLTRASIHKKASYAMLPLFISEAVLGQKMFNTPSSVTSGKQTAHRVIGMGIGGLFAVNTVTGVMNMWEGRKDPEGLIKRTIHGTLMLVADLGFLATAATRPNSTTVEGLTIYDAKKNQHMTIAYASITVATVGYLMMLFH